MQSMRIGIDIGGVIIAQDTDEPDLFFSEDFLRAKPFPDCFETIRRLIEKFGSENVFIISKCGEKVQRKSRQWLTHNHFFSITGFVPEHIHFCLERHEKAGIAENLELNIFIDDRYTVLTHLRLLEQIERLILFCPNDTEEELSRSNPHDKILQAVNWQDVGSILGI
jgi:uncharacterized HAD superfamily protein